jgi:ribosomal protein L40E
MTICPNCSHQNPSGAHQCEACFTPLPATTSCPNCGATVQSDATFCGQCGTGLAAAVDPLSVATNPAVAPVTSNLPPTIIAGAAHPSVVSEPVISNPIAPIAPEPMSGEPAALSTPLSSAAGTNLESEAAPKQPISPAITPVPVPSTPVPAATQLQRQRFQLTHVQSGTVIEIPLNLNVVHLGKPNEQIPPDIDVSGFPCSEVVSRVHADIRVEGDSVYLEDIGSANGTYVNHNALPKGNRHLLRVGDRISLGKGDLVTFLFQDM